MSGAILTRLQAYRRALHDYFSNTERRELTWLRALVLAIIGIWLVIMAILVWDNLIADLAFPPIVGSVIIMALTSLLAARGLSQYPGLAAVDPVTSDTDIDTPDIDPTRTSTRPRATSRRNTASPPSNRSTRPVSPRASRP